MKSLGDTVSSDESDSQDSLDIFPGAVPPGGRISSPLEVDSDNNSASEEDPESFIVEDDENEVALPLEFSMKSHSDLAHHFKSKAGQLSFDRPITLTIAKLSVSFLFI